MLPFDLTGLCSSLYPLRYFWTFSIQCLAFRVSRRDVLSVSQAWSLIWANFLFSGLLEGRNGFYMTENIFPLSWYGARALEYDRAIETNCWCMVQPEPQNKKTNIESISTRHWSKGTGKQGLSWFFHFPNYSREQFDYIKLQMNMKMPYYWKNITSR